MSKQLVIPNWKWRIDQAIKRGRFNEEDFLLVESIGTCAIGERLGLNRLIYGNEFISIENSLTEEANKLGYKFMEKVHNQKPREAYDVYQQIQKLKTIKKPKEKSVSHE